MVSLVGFSGQANPGSLGMLHVTIYYIIDHVIIGHVGSPIQN